MSLLDFSEQKPKVLVWFDTAFLGDVVLLTASMRQANKFWPECRQYLISNVAGVKITDGIEFLQASLVLNKKQDGFFNSRAKIKSFLVEIGCEYSSSFLILSHRSLRSFFLTSFLGMRRIGFRSFGILSLNYSVPYVGVLHEVKRKVLLLERFNRSRSHLFADLKPLLRINQEQCRGYFKNWILEAKHKTALLVAIAPGSVWPTKRYLKESFVRLVELILRDYPKVQIILLGSKEDKESADFIQESLKQKRMNSECILNSTEDSNLEELKYLISQSDVLISNDSAPTHVASAFDIPNVTIFGSTVKEFGFSSLSTLSAAIGVEDLYCRPCGNHGHRQCPEKHFRCMKDLSPEKVYQEFRRLLDGRDTDKI